MYRANLSLGNQLWVIEAILGHKTESGKDCYLVKWLGWHSKYNSWEPEAHLSLAQHMIAAYRKLKGLDSISAASRREEMDSSHENSQSNELSITSEAGLSHRSKKIHKPVKKDTPKSAKPYIMESEETRSNSKVKRKAKKGAKSVDYEQYGTFGTDQPREVIDHMLYLDESRADTRAAADKADMKSNRASNLMFKLIWEPRSDGLQPKPSWYTVSDMKVHCAAQLLEYYEKFLKFNP